MSRLESLIEALHGFYGGLPSPPHDPFGFFVWQVLSTHSTPHRRDAALNALRRLPALTPDAMWRAPRKRLEESVALAGPYLDQRLHALRAGADVFRRFPRLPQTVRGPLRAACQALRRLPQMHDGGVPRMLVFAANRPVLPIDSGIGRVLQRLGYGEQRSAWPRIRRSVREAIERELPCDSDVVRRAFLYLSHHSSATCTEGDPHCAVCPLLAECPHGRRRANRGARA